VCVPGAQTRCTCTNGVDGAQICVDDGSRFDACICKDPPPTTGGVGGHDSAVGGRSGSPTLGDGGAPEEGGAPAMHGDATDLPQEPILEDGVPANAPELFGAATDDAAGALCVLEPQLSADGADGAMFPSNWLRPRFRFVADDFDLFELRLHSDAERNDLVVYTKEPSWYLPQFIWQGGGTNAGLGAAAAGGIVSVTIRALDSSAPGSAARVDGTFRIAPAAASGSILFPAMQAWATSPESAILGFSVGDEGVQPALKLKQAAWTGQLTEDGAELRGYYDEPGLPWYVNGDVRAFFRPTVTPDGAALSFTDDWPWAMAMAQVSGNVIGGVPALLGKGGRALMKQPWLGSQTFSAAHWASGDRVLVTSYGRTFKSDNARDKPWTSLNYGDTAEDTDWVKWHSLVWFDLEADFEVDTDATGYGVTLDEKNAAVTNAFGTSWGFISTGDSSSSHVAPTFNPQGDTVAYVATDYSPEWHPDAAATTADVRTVAYNNRAGGVSQPVAGASSPDYLEFEPAFSPDGKLLAFTRAANGGPDGPFRHRFGEVMVVAASGGEPVRLVANDPNACAGDEEPLALLNGSAAWAPQAVTQRGKTYYFLVFTSARHYADEFAQSFEMSGNAYSNTLQDSTQIYLSTIVVDNATGAISTYPAIHVWNQNRAADEGAAASIQFSNITPVWGNTVLPKLEIPPR